MYLKTSVTNAYKCLNLMACMACLKRTSRTGIVNRFRYVTNGKKGIRGRMCDAFYKYKKANNKYMRYYDQNRESSYLHKNLNKWAKLQKLPFPGFKWRNDKSNLDEKFIKIIMKMVTKDTYLKPMLSILRIKRVYSNRIQSKNMVPYIQMNTKLRTKGKKF